MKKVSSNKQSEDVSASSNEAMSIKHQDSSEKKVKNIESFHHETVIEKHYNIVLNLKNQALLFVN